MPARRLAPLVALMVAAALARPASARTAELGGHYNLRSAPEASHRLGGARQRVVLVLAVDVSSSAGASIPKTPDVFALREYNAGLDRRLERAVYKAFAPRDYDVRVVRRADAHKLAQVLQSPRNAAVFYVAHSAAPDTLATGAAGVLTDYFGRDVRAVFKKINPGLRYLGLVGCESSKVIDELRTEGAFARNPGLTVSGFAKKVEARAGLRRQLIEAREVFRALEAAGESHNLVPCPKRAGFAVAVTRRRETKASDVALAPVVVRLGGSGFLGTLPAMAAGVREQQEVLWIEAAGLRRASQLTIALHGGDGASRISYEIVPLWTAGARPASWKVFAAPDGTPFGAGAPVYLFRGQVPGADAAREYRPFACST